MSTTGLIVKFLLPLTLVVILTGASPCSDEFIRSRNPYPWLETQALKHCKETGTNTSSCFALEYWVKFYGRTFPYPPPWAKSMSKEWCFLVGKMMPLNDPFHSDTVSTVAPLVLESPRVLPQSPQELFRQLSRLINERARRGFKKDAFVAAVDLFCTRTSLEECFTWKTNVRQDDTNVWRLVSRWERLAEEHEWTYDPWNSQHAWTHVSHLFDGKTLTTWSTLESLSYIGGIIVFFTVVLFIVAIIGVILYSCGDAIIVALGFALLMSTMKTKRVLR